MINYSLVIHGGCGSFSSLSIELEHKKEQRLALEKIIQKGWSFLEKGNTAIDTVKYTVSLLEDDPSFNAGIGGAIDEKGEITFDASLMDGNTLSAGAVGFVKNIKNPILLADLIRTKTRHIFMAGEGASHIASLHHMDSVPNEIFLTPYQMHWYEKKVFENIKKYETVGAVAFDKNGNIAAATSTGGLSNKMHGRIGDSAIIGAGTYASSFGGASVTGNGEAIIKACLTKQAIDFFIGLEMMDAQKAANASIQYLSGIKNGEGGIIIIDKKGAIGVSSNEDIIPHAYMTSDMEKPAVYMNLKNN